MKIPSRSDYVSTDRFLYEMTKWAQASEAAYKRLRGMYDVTLPFDEAPKFNPAFDRKHVLMRQPPTEEQLEPVLRNLSSAVLDDGKRVVRVYHGPVMDDWACFVDIERA